MKAQIKFNVINPDYNKGYADEYHAGKESESNWKYFWQASYEIKNVLSVEMIPNGTYQLKIKNSSGNNIICPIPDVCIYRCHLEDKSDLDFAVSKSILNKTHQAHNEKYDIARCYFYINSLPESIELQYNLILNVNEIPSVIWIKQG